MDVESLKFARTHEWVSVAGDIATVGISAFAVQALTDLVYVDLPAAGTQVTAAETCGEVESVKAVSDIYAPVSGEVTESNDSLDDDLDALSEDPYGRGWMIRIRMSNPSDLDALFDKAAYDAHCQSEQH